MGRGGKNQKLPLSLRNCTRWQTRARSEVDQSIESGSFFFEKENQYGQTIRKNDRTAKATGVSWRIVCRIYQEFAGCDGQLEYNLAKP